MTPPVRPTPAATARARCGRARALVAAVLTALALVPVALVAGCGRDGDARAHTASTASGRAGASATDSPGAAPASPSPARTAPGRAFGVGVRQLSLSRTASRPLPTTIWYPTTAGGAARSGAAVAAGRFPLVLFSHGLTGLPSYYAAVTTRIAAAGFVVAAPAYPFTNHNAPSPNMVDVTNQPQDASYVITEVLKLDGKAGDPLAGHVDTGYVAAAGHSAGGFTTAGMLATHRDSRLKGAVIIAGGSMGGFTGPGTPVLFVHGDQDPTVSYWTGRAAYNRVTWPKAFLTLIGGDHGAYLAPGQHGFDPMVRTIVDFLRWCLYGDTAAKGRLSGDGTVAGSARIEQHLG